MPLPKRRTSASKRDKRRSHDALVAPQFVSCPSCGEPAQRHRACRHCGEYRGRKVIEVAAE
jgi:large subunit ribosomal protein L32